jgi:NSS family neurotransmitter:Na+ symporter
MLSGGYTERGAGDFPAIFDALVANPVLLIVLHGLFMAITAFFVLRGVSKGIEFVATYMLPGFFVLLVGLVIYGAFTGDIGGAATYLFTWDASALTGPVMLAAVGQALFSIGLGGALMIVFGSYAERGINLGSTSGIIAVADTSVALIAGLAIFPIVFAAGLDPAGGPGLMFVSMPTSFASIPGGVFIGFLFFIMVFIAALTSSVSLLEVPTSWAMETFGTARAPTVIVLAVLAFVIGAFAALSFNVLAEFQPLGFIPLFEGLGIFDILDTFTGKLMLPIGALLVAIFTGWVADKKLLDAENGISGGLHILWRFLIAWLCPLVLTVILLVGIFPGLTGG